MKINHNSFVLSGIIAVATALAPAHLLAATNGFIIPSFRGAPDSQSGYWETLTVPVGAPGNLPDQPGTTTTAVLTQTSPNGFLTGSGNIYNFTDADAFTLTNTTPFACGTIVLQTRTAGSEIDYASVILNYTDGDGAHSVAPLFHYETDRSSGVSSLWQWNLTGLGASSYSLTFVASGSSMSLDSMTLDTAEQFSPAFSGQPFSVSSAPANLARWMYPYNASPASRPAASVFASFGSANSYDTRDAQYLLGWNTTNNIPAGQGARNYLIRHARVTLTISSDNQYVYSGILRDYRTYFPTNDPRYLAATNISSPIELYGAGFRGGYTALTYPQAGPFSSSGSTAYMNRNAYAAGFDTNGLLVDVSNNISDDGTNEIANPFEVAPFAVGQSTNVAEGELMPLDSQLTFDLNLDDPLIYGYVQKALDTGNLSLIASTLLEASYTGAPNYPNFYTIFNTLADPDQYPLLEIDGEVIRTNVDSDADGLPDDWENFHFGSLANDATNSFANDGVSNLAKYLAGTNPTNSAANLRLLSVQRQQGVTEVHFANAPSRQYTVQWSSDLQNWQTVTNPAVHYSSAWLAKTGTNLTYPAPVYAAWRDTNAAGPQRFYRIGAQ